MTPYSGARMATLLKRLWPLERTLVSDGYDTALRMIAEEYPVRTAAFPSGSDAWTWTIPEKWTRHAAYVETLDGRRIIDSAKHSLHCMDYSLSIDRVVDREELLAHVYCHPRLAHAVPYVFKYYERDWGLCCDQQTRASLTEPQYRVKIDTTFSEGSLKVGEWWLPGETDEVFVLQAHLCHPYLANDDLSGVVVALEVMRRLSERTNRQYTYLLLLVPETIGTVAWLSRNEAEIPRIRGGIFLEMLGMASPHGLARSYSGDTQVDRCCEVVLAARDPQSYVRPFAEIIKNDELEFNSPGLRIPMVSLSRSLPPEHPEFPFAEYHSHLDSPDIIVPESLAESAALAEAMVTAWDRNRYARARFKGQVFCSKYGLFPREFSQQVALIKVLYEIDGLHSVADICAKHRLAFGDVADTIDRFAARGLVDLSTRPMSPAAGHA